MRPLILDGDTSTAIIALKKHAEENKISLFQMTQIRKGNKPTVGAREGFELLINFGFRIIFSIEEYQKGWALHLSMSVDAENKLPNEVAVAGIMEILGFKRPLTENIVYTEPVSPTLSAINVIEFIKS